MAKRAAKRPRPKTNDVDKLQELVAQYEQVFDEVQNFIDLIRTQEGEVATASAAMYAAKDVYEKAKEELAAAREARDGTKHSLFVYLRPGPSEILPLFDRMEKADEKKHGEGSTAVRAVHEPARPARPGARVADRSEDGVWAADARAGRERDRLLGRSAARIWRARVGPTARRAG